MFHFSLLYNIIIKIMHYCNKHFFLPLPLGSTYNIPIQILFLKSHPVNAPLVFVKPTNNMLIKPSKHVDNSGRVYMPYLSEWRAVCVFMKTTF